MLIIFPNYLFASRSIFRYKPSTRSLAQGVFLRNFKLDLIDGSWVKQRMVMRSPSSSHP
jgi:hypothetical protein